MSDRNNELEEAFGQKNLEVEGMAFQILTLQERLDKVATAEK